MSGMVPCKNPSICGVANHYPGTQCRAAAATETQYTGQHSVPGAPSLAASSPELSEDEQRELNEHRTQLHSQVPEMISLVESGEMIGVGAKLNHFTGEVDEVGEEELADELSDASDRLDGALTAQYYAGPEGGPADNAVEEYSEEVTSILRRIESKLAPENNNE